jgi:hypothetical protein
MFSSGIVVRGGSRHAVTDHPARRALEQADRVAEVAFVGDRDCNLVPDVREVTAVVHDVRAKDFPVRNPL